MKEDRVITPTNQVRLTNVSVVRLNRGGKRFEVACYKNKIVNYRQGIETDLTEVLQTTRIFSNVSKGEFAPTASLKKAFGTTDENEICNWILDKGQIQVSNLERSAKLENTGLEIATMISEKCVNTMSQRRFTIQAIRDAMKEAEFCVHARKEVKQQFLDCVKLLKEKRVLPIERAKMLLAIIATQSDNNMDISNIVERLKELDGVKEISIKNEEGLNSNSQVTFLSDPSLYRIIDKLVKEKNEQNQNGLRLEIMQQCVFQEGEVNLGSEMERKEQFMASQQRETQDKSTSTMKNIEDEVDLMSDKLRRSKIKGKKKSRQKIEEKINDDIGKGDDDFDESINISNKQKQKKAQKKSKKAKRREIEEAKERLEQQRKQEEYEERRQRKINTAKSKTVQAATSVDTTTNVERACTPSTAPIPNTSSTSTGPSLTASKSCNTCGGSFTSIEYRAHFRSEWHRHNLKLKMKGMQVVTEIEYKNRDEDIFIE